MSEHEIDPEHPNDPLRTVEPMLGWPPGQPPVTPIGPWLGSSDPDRAWYWTPELLRGYTPILKRLELHNRDVSIIPPEYSIVGSPRILMAFLDPNDDTTPGTAQEFSGPSIVVPPAPVGAEPIFFAAAGTVGIVNATNDGAGYEFPMRTPMRYCGIWVSALGIGAGAVVTLTPVIHYVRKGVGQGG